MKGTEVQSRIQMSNFKLQFRKNNVLPQTNCNRIFFHHESTLYGLHNDIPKIHVVEGSLIFINRKITTNFWHVLIYLAMTFFFWLIIFDYFKRLNIPLSKVYHNIIYIFFLLISASANHILIR